MRERIVPLLLCANVLVSCGRVGFASTRVDALDAGTPGVDAGAPGVEAGAPGVDAAAPGVDAGALVVDAGAPGVVCSGDSSTDACAACEDVTEPADGDGCCPMGASSNDDSDCMPVCGNGVKEAGESCDPGSAVTACPLDCDDGDVCTRDVLNGAELSCDALCSNDPIAAPADEDGCCPEGANNTNDADCPPHCGNGVVETGEECDGTADCSNCMLTPQGQCSMLLGADACSQCGCAQCTTEALNCYKSGDSERDLLCPPVVECALAEDCTGTCGSPYYCYGEVCWGAGNPPPSGPCMTPISAAAGGGTTTNQVGTRSQDSSYPLYWSEQYATCLRDQCRSECGL